MTSVDLDSQRRADTIRSFDVLDRPPRHDLVAVADLAARVCGVPIAAVNLLTEREQRDAASVGFDGFSCSLEDSMCAVVLHEDTPVVVPDCLEDERFRDSPFVNGRLASIRFYASARLITREGVVIGTLCVFDEGPRDLDDVQTHALETLADRVVDILELSLASRELTSSLAAVRAMKAELERSNERLASFAGQVSHDLKTPLTSMALSLSIIREELTVSADGEAIPLLDRAIRGSTRMAALIDDVLSFARLGGELRRTDVDLDQVLRDVRTDLGDRLRGVDVEVGELPVVVGDEVQLRALVQNLVDNAAKYAHPARPPRIRVTGAEVTDGWRVEVTDNGRGVPLEDADWIFDPMTRADETVDGSGIRLATCRRVVEAHGGRIGFVPVETGGSMFWFELPS